MNTLISALLLSATLSDAQMVVKYRTPLNVEPRSTVAGTSPTSVPSSYHSSSSTVVTQPAASSTGTAGSGSTVTAGQITGLDTSGATMIQLFEWPWNSVAAECPSLAKWGYTHVQVSTPVEHITGSQWWTSYQPVSYKITSKRGTQAELQSMISTCASAGIQVVIDVVTNHMTGMVLNTGSDGYGVGFAGSKYQKYDYPDIYSNGNFHGCRKEIENWENITEVETCELSNLADLMQETASVTTTLKAFLQSLVDLGAVGFRMDAAKSIPSNLLGAITGGLSKKVLITQEVDGGNSDPAGLRPMDYTSNGLVQQFGAMSDLKTKFTSTSISDMVTPSPWGTNWGYPASSTANVFVANHDTERQGTSLNSKSPNNAYVLATIFMLGYDYGFSTVFSGYDFTGQDAGAPQNSQGLTNAVTCGSNNWRCEHRWTAFKNMALFRKTTAGMGVTKAIKGRDNQVAWARESTGFVVMNNDGSAWKNKFSTSLPAGSYCDIITSDDVSSCNSTITVASDGSFSATVAAYYALVLLKV